ncbi:MAG: hypothetical protein JEY96_16305 [Bacteroidales bacterium]|jgi:hypothetical protein|nr:hypothetical protein [Bacteroidales bacterium]
MSIRFFHTPKNKKFNFSPRYYDEQKEELEKRVEQIKKEMGVSDDDPNKPYVSSIRKGQMRGYLKKTSKQKRQSTGRLIIILLVLALTAYFLLYF